MPKPLTVWITINCGKFWKGWEYQTTWCAFWENYMQVRKQQLELICRVHHEKCWAGRSTSWNQDCWEKYQKLRYADHTTLISECEGELKSLLLKVKGESDKVGLKLNIQKTKLMASDPITSWQMDEQTMEKGTDFILGCSKITADGDCSHEVKRCLLLGRKVMTTLESILRSRDITLPTNVGLVKA